MPTKPIWCKCGKHSWTRRQLYSAWERGKDIRCPDLDCDQTIPVETVETLLIDIGLVKPDDGAPEISGRG